MTLEVGQVLDERYEVERLLGSGGLAEVYLVRHLALGSRHALKVLTFDRPSLDRRLLLEGRIQAQLRHPNIVAVTDVTRVAGRAALLMDFVDGPTLDQLLEAPHADIDALDLFAGILAAVVMAHDAGVLHRDLKPQNILIQRTGGQITPKVTDFGLAKLVAEEMAQSATRTNVTMGTPGYMAPEQVRDAGAVDARTDVFALGALLHELITGRPAFADDTGHIDVTATIERRAAPLPDDVPAFIREAIEDALSPDLARRPASARELAERLFPVGDPRHSQVLVRQHTPMALEHRESAVPTWSTRSPTNMAEAATLVPDRAPLSMGWWVALGGVGLFAGLCLALILFGGRQPATSPRPEPVDVAPVVPVVPAPLPMPPVEPIPEPSSPEPVDSDVALTPEPAPAAVPGPAPMPGPEPVAAPVPSPAAPEPVAEPEPAPQPTASPEPEAPGVEPVAEPDGVDLPPVEEAPSADLVGTWAGVAQGYPIQLRIQRVQGDAVTADLVFTVPRPRTTPLSGTWSNDRLMLTAVDDSLSVEAVLSGKALSGSYSNGRKAIPFQLAR